MIDNKQAEQLRKEKERREREAAGQQECKKTKKEKKPSRGFWNYWFCVAIVFFVSCWISFVTSSWYIVPICSLIGAHFLLKNNRIYEQLQRINLPFKSLGVFVLFCVGVYGLVLSGPVLEQRSKAETNRLYRAAIDKKDYKFAMSRQRRCEKQLVDFPETKADFKSFLEKESTQKEFKKIAAEQAAEAARRKKEKAAADAKKLEAEKAAADAKKLEAEKAAAEERAKNERYFPEKFLDIKSGGWHKDGFGSVAMVKSSRIKNTASSVTYKDIRLKLTLFADSGTKLGSKTQTVYKSIKPGQTIWTGEMNFGFINSQASSARLEVVGATVVE